MLNVSKRAAALGVIGMKIKAIILSIVFAATISASFFYGTRKGFEEYKLADAKYKASIAAHSLRMLDNNNIDNVRASFEIDLNSNLAWHYDYEHSYWKWIWPELKAKDNKAILNAVNYRIHNDYPDPILSNPANANPEDEFLKQVFEDLALMEEKREKILVQYHDEATSPNLSIYKSETYNK